MKKSKPPYVPSTVFVSWLDGGMGRAAYFERIDERLSGPIVSKLKAGRLPIDFEYAVRLERAQKPSDSPFKADEIMTFVEDQQLYRYVTGQEPAPAPLPKPIHGNVGVKRAGRHDRSTPVAGA